jgi:PPIC-type PPIASE domain
MRVLVKTFLGVLMTVGLGSTLLACGQSHSANPITVGDQRLSRSEVAGFASAIKGGSTFAWASPELSTYTEQASALLIRYHWLTGEAADQGLAVTDQAASRALDAEEAASLGGEAVYRTTLGQTGETLVQARLVLAAELSAQRLRQKIVRSTPQPTRAQVQFYYRSHLQHFRVQEERFFDLAERIDGPAELAGAKRAFANGYATPGTPYEVEFGISLSSDLVTKLDGDREAAVRAIFSTRPGVIIGPMPYYGKKAIFKVTRIVPGYQRPFSQVRGQIARKLRSEALLRARTKFIAGWRSKWTSQTECASGYVIYGCMEYHGRHVSEGDPLSPE